MLSLAASIHDLIQACFDNTWMKALCWSSKISVAMVQTKSRGASCRICAANAFGIRSSKCRIVISVFRFVKSAYLRNKVLPLITFTEIVIAGGQCHIYGLHLAFSLAYNSDFSCGLVCSSSHILPAILNASGASRTCYRPKISFHRFLVFHRPRSRC